MTCDLGSGIEEGSHLTLGSWLSSRKLARMEALSFWMTARSSAMVLAALTLRMNCFTEVWPLMVSFQCSSAMFAVFVTGLGDQLLIVRYGVRVLRLIIVT